MEKINQINKNVVKIGIFIGLTRSILEAHGSKYHNILKKEFCSKGHKLSVGNQ